MLKLQNKIPSALTIGGKIVERIKMRNEVVWGRVQTPLYIQNTYNGSNTVTIQQTLLGSPDSSTYAKHLQYSKNGLNWTTITLSSTAHTITLNKGEKVYFRGNEGVFNYWYSGGKKKAITTISANQTHTVGGNINTLLDYQDPYGLTLPQGAFCGIFENNTKLTSASDITFSPSVDGSLSSYCYLYLFKNCTNLTTVPKSVPAKKQGQDACNGMFAYTAITTAPTLPATILANGCYVDTFHGCSKLVNPPELPATTLKPSCYRALFARCTSLVNAPELPATTLAEGCYRELFFGCTSLINPPELPAKTLTTRCYQSLFYGCSKLNNVTVYANDISATNCTTDWLSGVASSGTFNNYGSATYTVNSPSGIPTGWTQNRDSTNYFYIESLGDGNTVSVINVGNGNTDKVTPTLEYSKDKNTWNTITFDWTSGTHTTELPVKLNTGGKMYFRNDTRLFSNSSSKYISFSSSVSSNVGGDIRTLSNYLDVDNETKPQSYMFYYLFYNNKYIVDASNLKLPYTTLESNCYKSMFDGCTSLTTSPTLPATTLADFCYYGMFRDCTSLTSAPTLPSTTLKGRCYYNMFRGCTKLTSAPTLPSTTLAVSCYDSMFYGCTSLTSAPALPATTLASYCYYNMFRDCTKLTSAPELPATTLADYCYYTMFQGCTSLTVAPELPATTLADYCYYTMFQGCTSLTSAPELPATTLADYCYYKMFQGCTKLNSLTVYANNISATNCTTDWLYGVSSTGTFRNLGSATYTTNSPSGIPSGWTEVKN